jgi:predicted nucleic acid-binding Zn ribbon protein
MKKQNFQSIGSAIDSFLKENRLDKKIDSSTLLTCWKEIAGEMIQKHTTRLFLKDQKMYLQVDSAALKNELHFLQKQLIDNINQYFKKELVKELILL